MVLELNSPVKILVITLITLLGVVGTTATALADEQRVLLSFDEAGHRVQQIVYPQPENSLRPPVARKSAQSSDQPDLPSLVSQLKPGSVLLVWTDDEGSLHATTTEADPRVSHAPTHIDGADKSRMANRSGAWLVAGPENATNLTILLPSDSSLGLGFEQWEVPLR